MKSFTIVQKLLSMGATYIVKEGETQVYTVKGKIFSFTPKLEMFKEADTKGNIINTLKGNFFKTQFEILDSTEASMGVIKFPFFAFIKKFTLSMNGRDYSAKGGFTATNFTCADEAGATKFTITKDFAFRDKFSVTIDDSSMDTATAILAAISIDQRFFQQK